MGPQWSVRGFRGPWLFEDVSCVFKGKGSGSFQGFLDPLKESFPFMTVWTWTRSVNK